jgi:hypothetical protein
MVLPLLKSQIYTVEVLIIQIKLSMQLTSKRTKL